MDSAFTKQVFDGMAERYDTDDRAQVARRIAGEMRTHIAPGSLACALDYGCGTGLVGLQLTDLFASMAFVDTSPAMVEQVRRKLEVAGIEHAEAWAADFNAAVPDPAQRFDCILLSQVLLHVRDVPLLLERLTALLNPGGRLLIVDFDEAPALDTDLIHPGFSQDELQAQLEGQGLRVLDKHTFLHGEHLLMNQEASLFVVDAVN